MSRSCDVRWDWGLVWVLVWLHMQNRVAFLEVLLHCLSVNCEDKVALCVSILFHRLINLTSKVIKKKKITPGMLCVHYTKIVDGWHWMSCQRQQDTHCISFSINAKRLTSLLGKKLKGGREEGMMLWQPHPWAVNLSNPIRGARSVFGLKTESVGGTLPLSQWILHPGAFLAVYRTLPRG